MLRFEVEDLESRRLLSAASLINQFPVTTVGSEPYKITTDNNGNVWFTEYQGNKIGEITATPQEFALASVPSNETITTPRTAAAPQGQVYLPGSNISSGTMLPAHTLFEFTLPPAIVSLPLPATPLKNQPVGIAAGGDGNIYFTESGDGEIGEISTSPERAPAMVPAYETITIPGNPATTYSGKMPIPTAVLPVDTITELYIPSSNGIPPPGVTPVPDEPPLPSPNSAISSGNISPFEITTGPGSNVYFTETGAGEIGEIAIEPNVPAPPVVPLNEFITTSDGITYPAGSTAVPGPFLPLGTIIEFITPTGNSGPLGITSDSAGNVWFTESTADNIGKLEPGSGAITEYSIGPSSQFNGPGDIALASGNLWFFLNAGGDLAYINPMTGVITYPSFGQQSFVIAGLASAGGDLWYTDDVNNQIGEINPAALALVTMGPITGTGTPLNQPVGITAGPENTLWFTEFAGNEVGQVQISSLATPSPTTLQLSSSVKLLYPGETVTFTAIVTPAAGTSNPTGNVTFTVNGQEQQAVPLQVVSGTDKSEASFSIVILNPGTQTITAIYSGDFFDATSESSLVVLGDGPTVLNVERMGVHDHATTLILKFNQPLDPKSAESLGNYRLTSAQGYPIRILQADYNSDADTVTLYPVVRLGLNRIYNLTVKGTGDGLTDTSGLLLDGAGTGQPGSNYVTVITRSNLVQPTAQKADLRQNRAKADFSRFDRPRIRPK